MTIEVKLREIVVDGLAYPVPTHLTWHKGPRRWAILLPAGEGARLVLGFPAKRHGSVRLAYIAAIERLEKARKAAEAYLDTSHKTLIERKRDHSLAIGIELDTQHQKTVTVHYLRVSVGSYIADTLIRRNLRVGVVNQYTKEHYDLVYAKALETREYLRTLHQKKLLEMRTESERQTRALIQKFLDDTAEQPA